MVIWGLQAYSSLAHTRQVLGLPSGRMAFWHDYLDKQRLLTIWSNPSATLMALPCSRVHRYQGHLQITKGNYGHQGHQGHLQTPREPWAPGAPADTKGINHGCLGHLQTPRAPGAPMGTWWHLQTPTAPIGHPWAPMYMLYNKCWETTFHNI